jgi:peptidoglycan/xylan/chitin deacetylase (PgdA/CDA1 family)
VRLDDLRRRAVGHYQRTSADVFFRRPFEIRAWPPVISFTFDDFPRSALHQGGEILRRYGLAGTYYVSLGLLDTETPSGLACGREDLRRLLEDGHELGCHTFDHCDAWATSPDAFESSIIENAAALRQMIPRATFRTFSYPMSPPRPSIKQRTAAQFSCCRGGGQTFNAGTIDLNYLRAYFLEKAKGNPKAVELAIDANRRHLGWLILATHDVCDDPSPFGCTPAFFEEIVKYAVASGARILPVIRAWDGLQ